MYNHKDYILSLSYGKDSLACLGAIKKLGLPLNRIITVDVWATDKIPADLPQMVNFKKTADSIIKECYGIEVEHYKSQVTYEEQFYKIRFNKKTQKNCIYGFPCIRGAWCNSKLKTDLLNKIQKNNVVYLGIACDEPNRFNNLSDKKRSPLVEAGWDEAYCKKWCEDNNLLSPIYTTASRGGCWFCHNQSVEQLRLLRRTYPDLWQLLLKWDKDSPVLFKPDGHTVHDFDKRFKLEDEMCIDPKAPFKWKMLDEPLQIRLF